MISRLRVYGRLVLMLMLPRMKHLLGRFKPMLLRLKLWLLLMLSVQQSIVMLKPVQNQLVGIIVQLAVFILIRIMIVLLTRFVTLSIGMLSLNLMLIFGGDEALKLFMVLMMPLLRMIPIVVLAL